jgi:hypothetical protein
MAPMTVSAGDATGDGKPDFFLTAKTSSTTETLWALTGYNGAMVEAATALNAGTAWADRDIVSVQDITGDQITDLVYRSGSGRLLLRTGIKDTATGGVVLGSLGSAAASSGGVDTEYGASGWESTNIRLLFGTPDANGDLIPDIWALKTDGTVRFYAGSRTALSGSGTEIVSGGWGAKLAIG